MAGAPPKYKTPEELQAKIDEYFNGGCNHRDVTVSGVTIRVPVITITGLSYYLGFASRQSFYDYEERGEFSYVIKRARLRVEQNYEEGLQVGPPAGNIFALKNMGWHDKTEQEHSGLPSPVNIEVTDPRIGEELKKLLE